MAGVAVIVAEDVNAVGNSVGVLNKPDMVVIGGEASLCEGFLGEVAMKRMSLPLGLTVSSLGSSRGDTSNFSS